MKVNIRGYAGADELDYLRNTINQFILDFQKKVYARGDDFNGSDKNKKY